MQNKIKRMTGIFTAIFTLSALVTVLNSQAKAQCFGSPDQWLAAGASVKSNAISTRLKNPVTADFMGDEGTIPSIVGLWHVHYLGQAFPGGDLEAYQIFNTGGTEVHNPNAPSNGVCLGAWVQTARSVKLTHRVWLYTPTGEFVGVGHLEVNITLGDKGTTQTGTLTMQLFDLAGNPFTPMIPGTLTGERVNP
jgi:hypothetical protein